MKEVQPWVTLSQADERSTARRIRLGSALSRGSGVASGAEARLLWKDAINPVTSVMKPRSAS